MFNKLLQYVLQRIKSCKWDENERISIAVVGIPSSGKSYLLLDTIYSLRNMGFQFNNLTRDCVQYKGFASYAANTQNTGRMTQTEIYACRPMDNIYGATIEKDGAKFDVDFVDIPGEVFSNTQKAGGQTSLSVFTTFFKELSNSKGKLFCVTEWKNPAGLTQLIVEPAFMNANRKIEQDAYKKTTAPDSNFTEFRKMTFQAWSQNFGWLNQHGYVENTVKKRTISGKELMKNLFQYHPDTVMWSLSETIQNLCPGLGVNDTQFRNNFMESFYFLYYCSKATDIVLCDKLLEPEPRQGGGAVLPNNSQYLSYNTLTQQLGAFLGGIKANVYLAFRGVDFMLQAKEGSYQKLIEGMKEQGYTDDKVRNAVYSIFAYSLWNSVNNNTISQTELGEYLGMENLPSGMDLTSINRTFVDHSCLTQSVQALIGLIQAHVGAGPANTFRQLLNISYNYGGANPSVPLRDMPPHVFFTCTPVIADFNVYKNDRQSNNQRFIRDGIEGPMKYFDTAGSHFCFGTYQLCLDILKHHGFSIAGMAEYGELLNLCMNP